MSEDYVLGELPGARGQGKVEHYPTAEAALVELLRDAQHARCCYGTREGDGRRCDCKFDGTRSGLARTTETTGCPELRAAIWVLTGALG